MKKVLTEKEIFKKEKLALRKKRLDKRFSRSILTKEADRAFSYYIRSRDKGKSCVTCYTPYQDNFQCGHFISRRYIHTRWLEKNAHGQCPKCNLFGSGEQYKHGRNIDIKYGQGTAWLIQNIANDLDKFPDSSILETIRKYYKILENQNFVTKKYYEQD